MPDGRSLADAFVAVLPDTKGFEPKLKSEIGAVDGTKHGQPIGAGISRGIGSGMSGVGNIIKGVLGASVVLKGVDLLGAAFGTMISEAKESAQVGRLTDAVLKSTGGAAHVTAQQVNSLSQAISNKVGVDDEAIQSGANLLLTFTNIRNEAGKGNDVFNQATQTITDMSAALGQDTKSSAIQLGKALQDPINGITALRRVGVSFTDQQKEQIKTLVQSGNTLGAQKVILAELNKEFGGAAAAATDPMQKLHVQLLNIAESLGNLFLPLITKAAEWLSRTVVPAIQTVIGWFGRLGDVFKTGGFAGAVGMLTGQIGDALPGIKSQLAKWGDAFVDWIGPKIGPFLSEVGKLLVKFWDWQYTVAIPALLKMLSMWGDAFVKWIQPRIDPMLAELKKLGDKAIEWLLNVGLPALGAALGRMGQAFLEWIQPRILPMLAELGKIQLAITRWIVTDALPKIIAKLGEWSIEFTAWVWRSTPGLLLQLGILLAKLLAWVVTDGLPKLAASWGRMGLEIAGSFWGSLISKLAEVVRWLGGLPGMLVAGVGSLAATLFGHGRQLLQGLIDGVWDWFKTAGNWFAGIGGKIIDAVKGFFGIHSPSTVFAGFGGQMMQGLISGMLDNNPVQFMGKVFAGVSDAFGKVVGWASHAGGAAAKAFTSAIGAVGGALSGGAGTAATGPVQSVVQGLAASLYGWTGAQWNALSSLISGESGWNPNAKNPTSTAYGLFQFLDSTWASYGPKTSNPALQAQYGLAYIAGRYGSPIAAKAFWDAQSPHWYDIGGYLPTGLSLAMNNTGRPERILGPQETLGGSTYNVNLTVNGTVIHERDLVRTIRDGLNRLDRRGDP